MTSKPLPNTGTISPVHLSRSRTAARRQGGFLAFLNLCSKLRQLPLSGLTFESSASEGAILTIPVGFNSEDFQPESRMKRYVDRNIGQWYKYLVNERGHELSNGDLRVVIGHDKSSFWGMAIFSSSQEQQSTNPLFLSFRPITHDNAVPIYEWLYSGSVEVKSGPDPRDIDSLGQQEPAWAGSFYENQCLFVRTLNAKMQDRRWKNLGLNSDFSLINLVPDRGPRKAATGPFVPDSMGSTGMQNATPSYQGLPNRQHASVHDDTMPSDILDSTLSMVWDVQLLTLCIS
ncbi:hypothetical protein CVT26_005901 [Gymnopilus dilepis]|uniref:Uncharacterized protein n=1 Tax=Gymnopilus dilepis TaxID=231916 RepID=A0A409Y1M9_9AGAR|nr:hypothetical protein CVT26_005901 [Gymnopilus dilepis]